MITRQMAEDVAKLVNVANDAQELIEPGSSIELKMIADNFLSNITGLANNEIFVKTKSHYNMIFEPQKDKFVVVENSVNQLENGYDFKPVEFAYNKYTDIKSLTSNIVNGKFASTDKVYHPTNEDKTLRNAHTTINLLNLVNRINDNKHLPKSISKVVTDFKRALLIYSNAVVFTSDSKWKLAAFQTYFMTNRKDITYKLADNISPNKKYTGPKKTNKRDKDMEIG